jgi:hypothetical protein
MVYKPKDYDHLKNGAVRGFSDSQLDQHFTLYEVLPSHRALASYPHHG